ncbi:MAG: hypothetical protein WBA57_03065 [Elainellaceae cyanobacterium]
MWWVRAALPTLRDYETFVYQKSDRPSFRVGAIAYSVGWVCVALPTLQKLGCCEL